MRFEFIQLPSHRHLPMASASSIVGDDIGKLRVAFGPPWLLGRLPSLAGILLEDRMMMRPVLIYDDRACLGIQQASLVFIF